MNSAHAAKAQRGSLSIGGNETLSLVARMPGGTILDILWAGAMNALFVLTVILLGIGGLTLHRYDVQRLLTWIAFGWFVLGALLLSYRGNHL